MMSTMVKRVSPFTGIAHEIEIPLDDVDFEASMSAHNNGAMLQDAFPTLTAGQREFIKTGITEDEWERFIGSDED